MNANNAVQKNKMHGDGIQCTVAEFGILYGKLNLFCFACVLQEGIGFIISFRLQKN
jgi:hypothetical protein